jgi:hypothetical protein
MARRCGPGPRTSGFGVALGPGRHELEVRVATEGGRAELGFSVMPARRRRAPTSSTPPGQTG